MALIPIIIAPDPRLKIKTKPVDHVDAAVRTLMDDMLETMYAANGIGLAAPQVGDARSVIVVDCARQDDDPAPIKMANPEIIAVSPDDSTHEEGCLSLPEHYADVVRPESITLRYLNENNKVLEMDADGILAVCIQHEMDHLEGILFVDHISALKRNMILRKLKKVKKQAAED
tara:strand:- start:69 stop:587 length:519 start_codon:yes stop_codon:yes gene_type:complete